MKITQIAVHLNLETLGAAARALLTWKSIAIEEDLLCAMLRIAGNPRHPSWEFDSRMAEVAVVVKYWDLFCHRLPERMSPGHLEVVITSAGTPPMFHLTATCSRRVSIVSFYHGDFSPSAEMRFEFGPAGSEISANKVLRALGTIEVRMESVGETATAVGPADEMLKKLSV